MNLGQNSQMEFDLFISHASTPSSRRPLAQALCSRKYKVWYGEFVLKPGDSLTARID
jgi:hypothetical protein